MFFIVILLTIIYLWDNTGIGLPGVAASGTIAANTLASGEDHIKLLKDLQKKGILQ